MPSNIGTTLDKFDRVLPAIALITVLSLFAYQQTTQTAISLVIVFLLYIGHLGLLLIDKKDIAHQNLMKLTKNIENLEKKQSLEIESFRKEIEAVRTIVNIRKLGG